MKKIKLCKSLKARLKQEDLKGKMVILIKKGNLEETFQALILLHLILKFKIMIFFKKIAFNDLYNINLNYHY